MRIPLHAHMTPQKLRTLPISRALEEGGRNILVHDDEDEIEVEDEDEDEIEDGKTPPLTPIRDRGGYGIFA